jgi:hypothetical protein
MKKAYRCKDCGKETIKDNPKKAPDCCGEKMEEIALEACRDAGPEASRADGMDEPCEDFTGKQK